jgi:ankyrin repeat protein
MAAQDPIAAIHTAAIVGNTVGVARMLDEDPGLLSSKFGGNTLLTHAAWNCHVGVVRLLLARGADIHAPNDVGDTALHLAAENGNEEVVSILLGSGADVFKRGEARLIPLISASSSGHMAVVQLLLRYMGGCALDERSQAGRTALWWAYLHGHVDVGRALLIAGADHPITDDDGTTPQQNARRHRHFLVVALIEVSTLCICHA